MTPTHRSITQINQLLASGEAISAEITRAHLDAIEARNPALNAFLDVFADRALDRARAIDTARSKGATAGPLAGVPIAIKDNICLDYGRTTCASRMLEHYESPFTATAARRLINAGAIILGKTNMDEFAMGSSGEHSAFGATKNPHDESRVTGGSSSGSAAAVAAGLAPAALGSDTGGSIRQPAALCGCVGVKPTYSLVSRWGLVAFASSLDQIGPITRTVEDAAILLNVICGHDELDSTSSSIAPPDFAAKLDVPVEGLRIGVPSQARSERNHPGVTKAFERTIEQLRSAGAQIVDIELKMLESGIAAYYIVAPAEASSNLARYDGIRYGHRAEIGADESLFDLYARSRAEGFGPEVQRRIMLGTYVLSSGYYDAYYLTALKARRLIRDEMDFIFGNSPDGASPRFGATSPNVHAILMPSTPEPAFRIGEKSGDPLSMYLEDVYTVTANLAGVCAMSIPAGTTEVNGAHLPIGVQLLCPAFEDTRLLRIGRMIERFEHPR